MTANLYATRNQVSASSDPGDAGLSLRRLARLLAGRLEQTSVRLHGHGSPRHPLVSRHHIHTASSGPTSLGGRVVGTETKRNPSTKNLLISAMGVMNRNGAIQKA